MYLLIIYVNTHVGAGISIYYIGEGICSRVCDVGEYLIMCIRLNVHVSLCVYIYVCVCVCMCVCMRLTKETENTTERLYFDLLTCL